MKGRIERIAAVLSFFTALWGIGICVYVVSSILNSSYYRFLSLEAFIVLLALIGSLSVLTLTAYSFNLLKPSKKSLLREKIKILELEKKIKELEEDG